MDENNETLQEIHNMLDSNRRIKVLKLERTISSERRKKNGNAIAAGAFFVSTLVAIHLSGIDVEAAIQTEIKALHSFDALKEYLATFTPVIYMKLAASALTFSKAIKHRKKQKEAETDLEDINTAELIEQTRVGM